MNRIGIMNMLDILSGKNYIYVPDDNSEEEIKKILIGHSIKKVTQNTLELDNGIQLRFEGNDGCSCGSGEYCVTELNECLNVITNVEFTQDFISDDDFESRKSYKIFVYAENKKIKLLQCDGDDGNGWYGTGYHIKVNLKEEIDNE